MLRTVQQLPLPGLTSGIDVLPGFLRGPKSDRQRDTAYSISNKINVQAPDRVRTPDRQGCLPLGAPQARHRMVESCGVPLMTEVIRDH